MSVESPEALVDILRATLSLVEHYGSHLEQTPTLTNLKSAIESTLEELDPAGENQRRRIEALGAPSRPSVQGETPGSARRDKSA